MPQVGVLQARPREVGAGELGAREVRRPFAAGRAARGVLDVDRAQLRAGQPIRLFKSHHPDYVDGGQLRDFIFVDDCVAVMLWLLDQPQVNGLFNVGTGKAESFRDMIKAMFKALKRPEKIEYIEMPENIRGQYQYFTQADITKLRGTGYTRPMTPLPEAVRDYVQGYLYARPQSPEAVEALLHRSPQS